MTLIEKLNETKTFFESITKTIPKTAITLGSGLSHFVDSMKVEHSISFSEIPHFSPSRVEGHPGKIIFGHIANKPIIALQGRIHYYEGHKIEDVVFPTRSLIYSGIKNMVITNAAGGINPDMKPGHLMVIRDHINLTGQNPLIGTNIDELGPRFPDMTEPYDANFSDLLVSILKRQNVPYSEGTYCGVTGPCYETAAEINFMSRIGGDAVGMSTVPEVIAAKHMGCRVAGISCITNLATGLSNNQLSHKEVKEVANKVQSQFCDVLKEFFSNI